MTPIPRLNPLSQKKPHSLEKDLAEMMAERDRLSGLVNEFLRIEGQAPSRQRNIEFNSLAMTIRAGGSHA